MKKLIIKLAFWLLKGKTIDYWARGKGHTPFFDVYVDGKSLLSRKWKRITIVFI